MPFYDRETDYHSGHRGQKPACRHKFPSEQSRAPGRIARLMCPEAAASTTPPRHHATTPPRHHATDNGSHKQLPLLPPPPPSPPNLAGWSTDHNDPMTLDLPATGNIPRSRNLCFFVSSCSQHTRPAEYTGVLCTTTWGGGASVDSVDTSWSYCSIPVRLGHTIL